LTPHVPNPGKYLIITNLESSAGWFDSGEEWFVAEQGALVRFIIMVEVFTSGLMETFPRAPVSARLHYGVRCVRAAVASVVVSCLSILRCPRDDDNQLE